MLRVEMLFRCSARFRRRGRSSRRFTVSLHVKFVTLFSADTTLETTDVFVSFFVFDCLSQFWTIIIYYQPAPPSTMVATPSPRRKALADALAGVSASLAALWVFYPMDVWKTRLQGSRSNNYYDDDDDKEEEEERRSGIIPLTFVGSRTCFSFAGWHWKTLHTISSSFCYFYIQSAVFSWYTITTHHTTHTILRKRQIHASSRLLLSAIAALLNTFLTLPLDVIASQQQARRKNEENVKEKEDDDEEEEDQELVLVENTGSGSSDDFDEETIISRQQQQEHPSTITSYFSSSLLKRLPFYWKGLGPSLLLCSNPAIHYTVFDSLKYRLLEQQQQRPSNQKKTNITMAEAFCLGIVAKFVATIITYPLIRAKVMLMLTTTSHDDHDEDNEDTNKDTDDQTEKQKKKKKNKTMLSCLLDEYQQHGPTALYRGLQLQLIHTLLKSALLMMVRERITRTTRRLLLVHGSEQQ